MIKAITFDLWSTIYQRRKQSHQKRLLVLKLFIEKSYKENVISKPFDVATYTETIEEAMKFAHLVQSEIWEEMYRTINAQEWLTIVLNQLNITLDAEHQSELETTLETAILQDPPKLAPGIRDLLADLHTRYRLAIISDTSLIPGQVLLQILEKDKLSQYFTHFTFSDQLNNSKPHPNAFLSTLKELAATPSEAVHIGDFLRTDIAGAQNVGMKAVQYIGLYHDTQYPNIIPDAIIQHHKELPALLHAWK